VPPPPNPYALRTPDEIAIELGGRLRALRLAHRWRRVTLAERTGVSASTIQRFETSGKITLENLLRLAEGLGRVDELAALFEPPPANSIDELERRTSSRLPRRGSR
jgi:transcriptional regulator with XRE-family HTH domain